MNEQVFNLDTRRFLKQFGVTAQREIEKCVAAALESGALKGDEVIRVNATLTIESLHTSHQVDGEISLK